MNDRSVSGHGGRPLVTVVIPAYNEERNVRAVYDAILAALGAAETLEIIFVDDGSTDGTARAVRHLPVSGPSVRLVRFSRNFGHQAALLAGLQLALGEAVITLDCDLQHPPALLPRMVEAWRGGAKVVQMIRTQTAGSGFFKSISSQLFYRFLNLLSETPVTSGAADFQLMDRDVVNALLQFKDRYPFLRGLVSWLGFPTTRLEYVAPERNAGKSGYTLRKMLTLSVHAITGLSSKPLRFSFYLGLGTAALCIGYGVFALAALAAGRTVPGWTSVVVMVTFLGAVQLVSIGIVGEDVARVYEQMRNVPRYVIAEEEAIVPRARGSQA